MKLICLLFTIAVLHFTARAQTFAWAKSMGSTEPYDRGSSIFTDAFGNVYTSGIFSGTVDFDPGAGIFNMTCQPGISYDMFLQKLDANGNFIWAKQLVGDSASAGYGSTSDAGGNIYITGFFRGTKDFDPGPGVFSMTSTGNADIYVLKLDINGNFIWAKKMGGIGSEGGIGIVADNNGIGIVGRFQSTCDFDPGPAAYNLTAIGFYDIFVMKLDANGNFVFAVRAGGLGNNYGNAISTDGNGNLIATGYFSGSADFDPGPGTSQLTATSSDLFLWKLSGTGQMVWVKQMIGTSSSGTALKVDANSSIYYSGNFQGTVDFDPGVGVANFTTSSRDYIVSKLDPNGNLVWAKQLPGSLNNGNTFFFENGIALDNSGNVYTTGQFSDTGDFDPGSSVYNLTSAGINDVFIQKMDNAGNFVWAVSMGGPTNDCGIAITVHTTAIYTTGSFLSVADFDPGPGVYNLTAVGVQEDIFIQKLTQTPCPVPSQPGNIAGSTSICQGASQTYSINAVAGATAYTWALPNGWTGTSNTTSITATAGATSGNISVTANNTCGSSLAQVLAVNVNASPAIPASINGNITVNPGQSISYSINPVNGATAYNWSVSGGGTIISGQNTTSITINWSTAGNYLVSVNAANNCGTSSNQNLNVAVSVATAIVNPDNQFQIRLTPNPSPGEFYLTAKGVINKAIRVEIFDMIGKMIYTRQQLANANDHVQLLNLRKFAAGVYHIRITINKKIYSRTVIKTH